MSDDEKIKLLIPLLHDDAFFILWVNSCAIQFVMKYMSMCGAMSEFMRLWSEHRSGGSSLTLDFRFIY